MRKNTTTIFKGILCNRALLILFILMTSTFTSNALHYYYRANVSEQQTEAQIFTDLMRGNVAFCTKNSSSTKSLKPQWLQTLGNKVIRTPIGVAAISSALNLENK